MNNNNHHMNVNPRRSSHQSQAACITPSSSSSASSFPATANVQNCPSSFMNGNNRSNQKPNLHNMKNIRHHNSNHVNVNSNPLHLPTSTVVVKDKAGTSSRHSNLPRYATPSWVYLLFALFTGITIISVPKPFQAVSNTPTLRHVFFYAWLTALSTGLGALPFLCLPQISTYWVGVSNAIAGGMMIGASYSLFVEGCIYSDPTDSSVIPAWTRTVCGALLGLFFISVTKQFLDKYEDLKVSGLSSGMSTTDARKALLIFFVMTLHSFSEGVGVGVSFGGVHGSELGAMISASLAVHNVPEGLALAVVLLPRGASVATAGMWAICTSLPQPIMAVPAYLFVHSFIPILPVGLGFAGGAMTWVALYELLLEAVDDTNLLTTCLLSIGSLLSMLFLQHLISDGVST